MYQIVELSNMTEILSIQRKTPINQKVDPLHMSFAFCYLMSIYPSRYNVNRHHINISNPVALIDPNLDHPDLQPRLRRQYMYVKSTCA